MAANMVNVEGAKMIGRSGYIVLDFETTGFPEDGAEVLQVAVIDDKGETLMNGYCRPEHVKQWTQAQAVHGITLKMVADCPTFREGYLPKLIKLMAKTAAVIAYNAEFEKEILRLTYGEEPTVAFIDPMLMFAEVYGDWSEYHMSYRWQKLSTAARYYGYDFKAHDALEDVQATRFVFEKMLKAGVEPIML